jgi:type II secretory pathway predicted ATPase ExeA
MSLTLDEQLLAGTQASIPEMNQYFHLLEHPFLSGPDLRFLFTTEQVKDSIAKTLHQVFYDTHHILMSGDFGNGKTTIILRIDNLLKHDGRFNVKFLQITPDLTKHALLRSILREFNQTPAGSAHEKEKAPLSDPGGATPPGTNYPCTRGKSLSKEDRYYLLDDSRRN